MQHELQQLQQQLVHAQRQAEQARERADTAVEVQVRVLAQDKDAAN